MAFDWFKRLFQTNKQTDKQTNELLPSDIEKDSLQLGFAAGFTGRSIHDINSSLSRIEGTMPTKDWLLIQIEELTKRLEEGDQRRLEIVLTALNSLHLLSKDAPEPIRTSLTQQIKIVEDQLGLSKTMIELVQLVKMHGEVSYQDLARQMSLTDSGLRNLVFMTLKRTNEVEKFDIGKKRGLKYVSNKQTNVQDTFSSTETSSNNQTEGI